MRFHVKFCLVDLPLILICFSSLFVTVVESGCPFAASLHHENDEINPHRRVNRGARTRRPSNEAILLSIKAHHYEKLTRESKMDSSKTTNSSESDGRRVIRSTQNSLGFEIPNVPVNFASEDDASSAICSQELDAEIRCDYTYPYRSLSGRCNNLRNPIYGKHTVPFRRLLKPVYTDGVSKTPQNLPNARLISLVVHSERESELQSALDRRYTLMLMQWGQLVDHDLTLTPMAVSHIDNSTLDCETCQHFKELEDEECFPIQLPGTHETYFPLTKDGGGVSQGREKNCIPFTRSLAGQTHLGYRDQINVNTAYLDASFIYGSTPCRTKELRDFDSNSGKLRVLEGAAAGSLVHGGLVVGGRGANSGRKKKNTLLPTHHEFEDCLASDGLCFYAGDDRSNEQPGLISLHTIMLREHNRIADQLAKINTNWSDEKLFQETRKIVIAITQHITYSEFLPKLFGMPRYSRNDTEYEKPLRRTKKSSRLHSKLLSDLEVLSQTRFTDRSHYNAKCSANIYNEFATAAFRFGHSLIQPSFQMMSKNHRRQMLLVNNRRRRKSTSSFIERSTNFNESTHQSSGDNISHFEDDELITLKDHFNNPDITFTSDKFIDHMLRGMTSMPMARMDSQITSSLTNHLFDIPDVPFSGMDLAAINIQRSRDHALPGYVHYRNLCQKKYGDDTSLVVKDFNDLMKIMKPDTVRKLQSVYRKVEDIDLFTGGVSEPSIRDDEGFEAVTGFTFTCLIAIQFRRIKRCDRFWYEHGPEINKYGHFTSQQLGEVRKVQLASLICNNGDDIQEMQRDVFGLVSTDNNELEMCSSFPQLNLHHWKDDDVLSS